MAPQKSQRSPPGQIGAAGGCYASRMTQLAWRGVVVRGAEKGRSSKKTCLEGNRIGVGSVPEIYDRGGIYRRRLFFFVYSTALTARARFCKITTCRMPLDTAAGFVSHASPGGEYVTFPRFNGEVAVLGLWCAYTAASNG